jgi:hypothetical protein
MSSGVDPWPCLLVEPLFRVFVEHVSTPFLRPTQPLRDETSTISYPCLKTSCRQILLFLLTQARNLISASTDLVPDLFLFIVSHRVFRAL